jgi:hypothetical protein
VTQEEKDAFAKVMQKMNSHRLLTKFEDAVVKLFSGKGVADGQAQNQQQQLEGVVADRYAHLGLPVEHVRENSLNWILKSRALLVPDGKTRPRMRRLAQFTPVWGGVQRDRDLEKELDNH